MTREKLTIIFVSLTSGVFLLGMLALKSRTPSRAPQEKDQIQITHIRTLKEVNDEYTRKSKKLAKDFLGEHFDIPENLAHASLEGLYPAEMGVLSLEADLHREISDLDNLKKDSSIQVEELEKLLMKRANKYIQNRASIKNINCKFQCDTYYLMLYLQKISLDSLWTDKAHNLFWSSLNNNDKHKLILIDQVASQYIDNLGTILSTNKITFNICNKRSRELSNYSFLVSGQIKGRSTKFALDDSRFEKAGQSHLSGDYIVAPNACIDLTWTYHGRTFSSYEITEISGNWSPPDSAK